MEKIANGKNGSAVSVLVSILSWTLVAVTVGITINMEPLESDNENNWREF